MHKRFFSFVLCGSLFLGNLFANNFDNYKQAFDDANYNEIFSIYRENINKNTHELYKEYLFKEIANAIQTNKYHAQKLTNQFLLLEPNNNYALYFLALLLYEDEDYIKSYEIAQRLYDGYLEADLNSKIAILRNKLSTKLQPKEKERTIALTKRNNQYFLDLYIDTLKVRLLIDTGATTTMINSSIATQLYYKTINENIDIQTASGNTKAKRIEVQKLSFEDLTFEKVEVITSKEDVFKGFDGLLGMNILKHFQLDTKKNRLIFEH